MKTACFKTHSITKPCTSLETLKNVCDLDSMTLVLKLELDIIMTYFHTRMRSLSQMVQKLLLRNGEKLMLFDAYDLDFEMRSIGHSVQKLGSGNTDRQTCVKPFIYPLSRAVNIAKFEENNCS